MTNPRGAPKAPKGGNRPNGGVRKEWRGWLDYQLSAEETAHIKTFPCDPEWVLMWIEKLTDSGLSVSFREDGYNKCQQCTFTHTDQTHEDAGLGLTGRGSTAAKAFRQAMYIHTELLSETWSAFFEKGRRVLEIDD